MASMVFARPEQNVFAQRAGMAAGAAAPMAQPQPQAAPAPQMWGGAPMQGQGQRPMQPGMQPGAQPNFSNANPEYSNANYSNANYSNANAQPGAAPQMTGFHNTPMAQDFMRSRMFGGGMSQ